jgi:peptidoglycan hydrolase-like amidase
VQLIVQAPIDPGSYWMEIDGIRFTLTVAGRRARTGTYINPFYGNPALIVQPASKSASSQNQLKKSAARRTQTKSSAASSTASSASPSSFVSSTASSPSGRVRIRLSTTAVPTVTFQDAGTVGGKSVSAGTSIELQPMNGGCEARVRGDRLIGSDVLTLESSVSHTLIVDAVRGAKRLYAGTLECRIVDGKIAVINELPIEQYMEGLSEEPDSEPYEKQRAFAVAARTYVAHYALPSNRKFPGKPYDGTDDPAFFQSYSGVQFGSDNPNWMRAVRSTAGQILSIGGAPIRPPYFTSDDGRTRSPAEAGWKNFPFAEVFTSKKDPWCIGKPMLGHGVGMSGCGAAGQAMEGRSAEQILQYYYPGTRITQWQ